MELLLPPLRKYVDLRQTTESFCDQARLQKVHEKCIGKDDCNDNPAVDVYLFETGDENKLEGFNL